MKEVIRFIDDRSNIGRHEGESTEQIADHNVSNEDSQLINLESSFKANANEVNISSQQPTLATSNLPVPTVSSVPAPVQNPMYPVNQCPHVQQFFQPNGLLSNMVLQRCNIVEAGVSLSQAQRLNFNHLENVERLNYKFYEHLEEERHKLAMKKIDTNFKSYSNFSTSSDCSVATINVAKFNWNNLRQMFIDEYSIVKERMSSKVCILIKEPDENRHVSIVDSELKDRFREFLEGKIGWDFEISDKELERESKRLIRQIPILSQSDLRKLEETTLAFENGYFDIIEKQFLTNLEKSKIFNKFSMLYSFDSQAPNPDAFDAVLYDMFASNESLITLAYEIIGAIISPVSTLKRIYVFQGVSHGGKTRLSNIVLRLIDENDVYSFNTVSDITNDELVKQSHNCRLVYIKDCSRHKLKDKQISYLKSFADGGRLSNSAVFKILICTNYKIVTGDNDYLEPALKNRFQTLQFPKAMDNVEEEVMFFEEHFFEREKTGIVKKALEAFHNVMVNGGRFSYDFPINECVEATNAEEELTEAEKTRVEMELQQERKVSESKIEQVVNKLFIFTDDKCGLSAKEVFKTLNQCLPDDIKDTASMGRKISQIFKDKLNTNRTSEGTFYNLHYRNAINDNEA